MPETPLLNIPEAKPVTEPKVLALENAGEEYAKNISLSPETIENLLSLMINKEDYIKNIEL